MSILNIGNGYRCIAHSIVHDSYKCEILNEINFHYNAHMRTIHRDRHTVLEMKGKKINFHIQMSYTQSSLTFVKTYRVAMDGGGNERIKYSLSK